MNNLLIESGFLGVILTIGIYAACLKLREKVKNSGLKLALNPLLITIAVIIALLLLFRIPYESYEPSGERITWLLTPATVCFAVPLYRQAHVLRRHGRAILVSIFMGSLASVGSIFIMAKLLGLPLAIHASLAPKSVTTPIATGIAEEMGGIVGCTVIAVILTGIIGSIFTASLKKLFHIKSDIAWGLATGTSSHAIGTSAVISESELAGAMGSLSIALAGIITVALVPILSGLY
ncbi:MAG: LrgB family protein [Firmicutes bacterium]|nr:LrgB family protein [Bacillota bacterium]